MNNLVSGKYHQLSGLRKVALRKEFSSSPKMLRFIELLEKVKGRKISVQEAVGFIYKNEPEDFETLRNRFFKLRKKVLEHIDSGTGENQGLSGLKLMPLEEEFYRCRDLVYQNHFQNGKSRLEKLRKECWERNIFEILPDAINLSIFCNLALNVFNENEKLHESLEKANELLFQLNQQRQIARKFYQGIIEHKKTEVLEGLVGSLKRIAGKNKAYPRFSLYYQFILLTHGSGIYIRDEQKVNSMFRSIKKQISLHPDVPLAFYEPFAPEIIQYYLLYAEAMFAFQQGDILLSYSNMNEAWDLMNTVPALRFKKTESNFSNRIAIEVALGKYRDSLTTAEELLEFLKEQKQEEKRLKAYSEIVQIYSYAFPSLLPNDVKFLGKKLDAYINTISREDTFLYYGTLLLKSVFLFQQKEYKKAHGILKTKGMDDFLARTGMDLYRDVIFLGIKPDLERINSMIAFIEKNLKTESQSALVFPLRRALEMLRFLKSENAGKN